MSVLPILCHPDIRLRTLAQPVDVFDDDLQQLTQNMLETMYANDGIGLAATQVNVHRQIVVMDISEEKNSPQIFINPVITILQDAQMDRYSEGCLSVPGFTEEVWRKNHVRIDFQTIRGKAESLEAEGLLAICIQHECDHLNGKLFIDYLSLLKRQRITTKLKKKSKVTAA